MRTYTQRTTILLIRDICTSCQVRAGVRLEGVASVAQVVSAVRCLDSLAGSSGKLPRW
jgi:hypothetical protein